MLPLRRHALFVAIIVHAGIMVANGCDDWLSWTECKRSCDRRGQINIRSCELTVFYVNETCAGTFLLTMDTLRTICGALCLGQGGYVAGTCQCNHGAYNISCCPMCDPDCQNNGLCISEDTCSCPDGFYGRACENAIDYGSLLKPQLYSTVPLEDISKPLSWYQVPNYDDGNMACFVKVQLENGPINAEFAAVSKLAGNLTHTFGNFTAAPIDSSASLNGTVRFACLQVKCPSFKDSGGDMNVVVDISLIADNRTCILRNDPSGVAIQRERIGRSALRIILENGNNYGPKIGIFISTGYRNHAIYQAKQSCYSGTYYDFNSMDPSRGLLAKFTC